jgi:phospholipid transport system transporter-binding protein
VSGSEQATRFGSGERWSVQGPLTIDSAAAILAASQAAPLPGSGVASLHDVGGVDSAAVAVLLSWRRRAIEEGKTLRIADVPESVAALAQLYGVDQLLFSETPVA